MADFLLHWTSVNYGPSVVYRLAEGVTHQSSTRSFGSAYSPEEADGTSD